MILLLSAMLLSLFPPIGETIPEGKFSYPGKSLREIILLDPDNSPLLTSGYLTLKQSLTPDLSEEEILKTTMHFVANQLFSFELCTVPQTTAFILISHPNEPMPEIPIDAFIKAKTGVCRHLSLCCTYYIHKLIAEGFLKGKTFLIRAMAHHTRHAWTLLLTEKGAWHIDPCSKFVKDARKEEDFNFLRRVYGRTTMDEQKVRWERED